MEPFNGHVRIVHNQKVIADSNRAFRVLETSHPPTYYIPMDDINMDHFEHNAHNSFCEYKGTASYLNLIVGEKMVRNAGWFYVNPNKAFSEIKNYASFYASKFDECIVNDEKVLSQEGDFYGGWITSNIKGPFKGGPGTYGW